MTETNANHFPLAGGLELKAPPVLTTAIAALLMWAVALALPGADYSIPADAALPVGLAICGLLTCFAGVVTFWRARTTVNPLNPASTSALVVTGIYRFSRNPMYLGFLLVLAGWALLLSNLAALLVLPAFVLYLNRFQIRPEERVLAARFADDYQAYQARVRPWL